MSGKIREIECIDSMRVVNLSMGRERESERWGVTRERKRKKGG